MAHAPVGRRIVALVIDWALAVLASAAIFRTTVPPEGLVEPLYVLAVFVVAVGLLTGLLGYSIGKRVVGLRVEGADGRPIGVPRALLRTVLICLVVPPIVTNDEQRGLHDIAVTSRVVRSA